MIRTKIIINGTKAEVNVPKNLLKKLRQSKNGKKHYLKPEVRKRKLEKEKEKRDLMKEKEEYLKSIPPEELLDIVRKNG